MELETMQEMKKRLRSKIALVLSQLSKEEKTFQSKIVREKLFKMRAFQESKRISIYLSTKDEIDTEPILRKMFDENRNCFIPRYSKNNMDMVKLKSMEDWENLPLTSWHIKQPSLKEKRENALDTGGLELIILPGVAFTKEGKRLGHGGGYYDVYVRKIKETQEKKPITIGLAFREQMVDDLPSDPHDEIIDKILYAD